MKSRPCSLVRVSVTPAVAWSALHVASLLIMSLEVRFYSEISLPVM